MRLLVLCVLMIFFVTPAVAMPHPVATVHCTASNPRVWVNTDTHVYHMRGDKYYGKTQHGMFMCKRSAIGAHNHAAKSNNQ